MPGCRCISSPPTSSRATAWCCRKVRPPRRSSPPPRSPALLRRSITSNHYLADGAISTNTPIRVAVGKGAQAPDRPADRPCLRGRGAAGRRGRQCAACADAADRAAIGQRTRRPRSRNRVLRGAAAVPAGRLALRFLANRRPYRAVDQEHRGVAGAERPGAAENSRRAASAQSLIRDEPRDRPAYVALQNQTGGLIPRRGFG